MENVKIRKEDLIAEISEKLNVEPKVVEVLFRELGYQLLERLKVNEKIYSNIGSLHAVHKVANGKTIHNPKFKVSRSFFNELNGIIK